LAGTKRRRIRLGDIYAIPLPNGKFGNGRIFNDAGIAIYRYIGDSREDLPKSEDYQFIVGVYKSALKSEDWTIVDSRPFNSEDESWPPPTCIYDSISGSYSIYHKGIIRDASKSECEGLETAAVWEAAHIIGRIMGDDKWHR